MLLVIDLKLLVQVFLVITYLRLSILNSFSQTQKLTVGVYTDVLT